MRRISIEKNLRLPAHINNSNIIIDVICQQQQRPASLKHHLSLSV